MARKSQPFRESDKEQLKQDAGEAYEKSKDVAEDLANLGAHTAQDTKEAAAEGAGAVRQSARQAGQAASEEAASLKGQGSNLLGQAQDAASQKVGQAQKSAKNVKDAAGRQASALGERGQELAANAQDAASRKVSGVRQQAHHARDALGDARDIATQEARDLATQGSDLLSEAQDAVAARIPTTNSLLHFFIGQEYSLQRTIVAFTLAFWSATIVRVICISPSLPVFGPHLSQTLAPIERDDVSWGIIAFTRLIDLALAVTVYSWEGTKMDAPFLGVLLTGISRPTLYQFFHHHFLLSTKTVTEVLLTDAAASATSLFVISKLVAAPPTFRPPPMAWFKRHMNSASLQSIILALGLGTLLSALIEFVSDRVVLHQMMRAGVLEHLVPSYYASNRPSGAFIQRHPLLPVPTLRNDFSPLAMPQAIINAAPFALSFTLMSLFVLPQFPTRYLSTVVALLTGPAAFLTLWNLLPVHPYAAAGAATIMAARQAAVATVIAWVLTDLRRPVESSSVEVVKVPIRGREIDGSRVIESPNRKDL